MTVCINHKKLFFKLKSMKIKTRLIISFSILSALIILPNCITLYKMNKSEKSLAEMTVALETANVRLMGIMASFVELRVEASKMGVFKLQQKDVNQPLIPTKRFYETDDKLKVEITYLSSISPNHKKYADRIEQYRVTFTDTYAQLSTYNEFSNKAFYYDKVSKFLTLHDSVNNACKQTLTFLNNIIVEQEKASIESEKTTKSALILFMVFGIIIALIATYRILHSLLHPLKVMTNATKKIRLGDYNFRMKLDQRDEFGQLGDSFNRMLDELDQAKFVENQKQELENLNAELKIKNDSLDSFVYRVSHDLKAPIINISSLLTLVKKKVSAEDKFLNQTLGFIDDSVKKLQNTIHDLLEVSRIERNLQGEIVEVNLNDMIADIHTEFGELIRSNEAVIETDFTEGGNMVDFAKANMKSILSNIISNGIKYKSPLRKPVIKLTTTMEGDFLKLKIEDNGIGIDLNRHGENLFKMFSRFHSHVEGSGVGLYIVHKLITENGGKIKLESDLSKGSTFNIYFKTSKKPAYV
jgi:signal transduction histidine kinase